MTDFYRDKDAPVQPDQFAIEFSELLNLYKSIKPRKVLEIGVREGGTLYQWMKHAKPKATIVAIEMSGGPNVWGNSKPPDVKAWLEWAQGFRHELIPIIGNSHDPLTIKKAKEFAPFDFIFFDADHSYNGIACDFLAYSQLIRPGGIVAIHDICQDASDARIESWRYWQAIKDAGHQVKELISDPGQRSRGIGVVYA